MIMATQTKNFLSIHFPLRGGGVGGGDAKKMQGNFWVCPRESASAVEARSSAIGAYDTVPSHHALPRVRSQSLRDWKWVRAKVRMSAQM